MPIGPYPDYPACIAAQKSRDETLTDEAARAICASIEQGQTNNSIGHFTEGEPMTIDGRPLPTEDLLGVEIFSVGNWNGEPYTEPQIEDLINNTNELIGEGLLEPPSKIGHKDDQQFLEREGYPAAGWVTRLYRMGEKVLADVTGVPEKIATLIKARAYANISSEIWRNFGKAPNGKTYHHVLKAIAFLGEEIPAVNNLDDIVALYGSTRGRHGGALTYASDKKSDAVIKFSVAKHDLSEATTEQIAANIADEFEQLASKVKDGTKGKIGAPRMRAFLTETAAALRGLMGGAAAQTHSETRHVLKHSDATRGGEPPWSEVDPTELPREAFADASAEDKNTWAHPHHWVSGEEMFLHVGGLRASLKQGGGTPVSRSHLDAHASATGVGEYTKGANMEPKIIAKALGLAESASEADILAAVAANTEKAAKFAEAEKEVSAFKEKEATALAAAAVSQAITDRKVAPAQKAWATKFAKENPEGFKEYLTATPAIFAAAPKGSDKGAPEGESDARQTLNRLALEKVQESKGEHSYTEALVIVRRENPDVARAAADVREN